MKKMLIGIMLVIVSSSCKKNIPVDYILFSGQIENTISDHIILSGGKNNVRDTILVSENGSFSDTLKIDKGSYLITHGKLFLRAHLEPALHLKMTFNTKDFKNTLSFSGLGGAINTYLQDKGKKQNELTGSFQELYGLDEVTFKQKVGDIKTALEQLIKDQKGISDDYKQKELRNIEYEYISKLKGYQKSHSYITKDADFKVSNEFLPTMAGFKFDNAEDFEFSRSYQSLVSDHFREQSKNLVSSNNLKEDIAYLTAISKSPNQDIKNKLLFEEAKYGISYTSDLESYFDVFINASTDKENNTIVTQRYKKLRQVAKGNPSPKFYDYENYDGSKTSLDDLKGKYVYIDVWATWCGPCIKEIPFLKEVEKNYHNKNIEFLSVSIDKQKDHDKWKKMIEDKNLGGIQVLADNAWESKFVQDYSIMGIPRFILLDPQGRIVTANAPRPSEDSLITLFKSLNI